MGEDLWNIKNPSVNLALGGATIIVNPAASNELIGKYEYRKNLLKITFSVNKAVINILTRLTFFTSFYKIE